VAMPRPTAWLLRSLTVLALATTTVGALPATGTAAPQPPVPRTAAEARAQLAALSEQAEIVAEQYNDARVLKAKRDKEFLVADRKARAIQGQYAVLAAQVKQVVSAAYKNVPFGQFTTMLTSTSPREFIDQLSALGLLASRRGALIRQISSVRAAALKAQADAQAKRAAANKLQADIRAKYIDLQHRSTALRAVLSRLSLQERAALAGTYGRASRSNLRAPVTVGPASPAAQKAVEVALAQRGDSYCWGCAGPNAFDCSGLTMYAWAAAGVSLPHSSSSQYGVGTHVSRSEVRAGDLVFFYSPIHHVGIAINNSQMVHAPNYGQVVQVSEIDAYPYVGATRVG
jgi:cell wall-associated NlpC family hydrolase